METTSDYPVKWTELPAGSLCEVLVDGRALRLVVWPDGNAAWCPASVPVFKPSAKSKKQGPAKVLVSLMHDECTVVAGLPPDQQVDLGKLYAMCMRLDPAKEVGPRALVVRRGPVITINEPLTLTSLVAAARPVPWAANTGVLAEELTDGEIAAYTSCKGLADVIVLVRQIQRSVELGAGAVVGKVHLPRLHVGVTLIPPGIVTIRGPYAVELPKASREAVTLVAWKYAGSDAEAAAAASEMALKLTPRPERVEVVVVDAKGDEDARRD